LAEESKKTVSFELKNPMLLVFLVIAIAILILELGIIEGSPIAFGDDAYHAYIAKYIGTTLNFPKVLPGLNSYYTYSPLLHLLSSLFYATSAYGEILVKALIPVLVFITGLGVFVTVSRFLSRSAAFIAAVLTITMPIITTYSVLIYTDILMMLFFALSSMFTLIAERDNSKKYWVLAVVFAGLSFLSKGIGIISFGFIGFVLLYKIIKKELGFKEFLKLGAIVLCIAILTVGGWLVRNIILFKAVDCNLPLPSGNCAKAVISPDIVKKFEGYVTPSGSNVGVLDFGLKNFLIFMYGSASYTLTLWLVPLAVIVGVVFAVSRMEKIDFFILVLLFLSILPSIAVSIIGFQSGVVQRTEDVARYLILSAFTVALISAIAIDKFSDYIKKYWRYFTVIVLLIVVVLSWLNVRDKLTTMSSVIQFSPSFFQACDFIKSNTEHDAKFLSLWAGPTVYNCERTAEWESNQLPDIVLSQNLTTVLNALKVENISYIFIQKFALSQTPYQASIPVSFVQFLNATPKNFENIYENGPKLQDCISQGGCDGTIVYKIVSS
jgi:4-amino-4-deoxy-L-arabinose transferase-like glycosyltransferase